MQTKRKVLLFLFLFASLFFLFLFSLEYKKVLSFKNDYTFKRQEADCAVVLTGGPGRIREGIDLLANKSVKKLIISGVNPNSYFKQIFPMWVYYPEVTESSVVLEKRSETTFGNAIQSLPLAELLKCQDVLLITSQIHMYRAEKTFRKIFPKNIQVKANPLFLAKDTYTYLDVVQETFKSLFYSLWVY